MKFHSNAIYAAQFRQYDGCGMGFPCARCGSYTDPFKTDEWFAIPRIPVEKGGKKADNCVIVCAKCYKEIEQDGTKVIPYIQLPYFKSTR